MLRLLLALTMGSASGACALAAVGWVLYAQSHALPSAVQLFAAWGCLAGLACGALHLHVQGPPALAPAALSAADLAGLVRATLAAAAAERQARPGSAADRRPAAAAPAALVAASAPAAPAVPQPSAPAKLPAEAEAGTP